MNNPVRIPEEWLNLKKTLDQYGQIFQGQMRDLGEAPEIETPRFVFAIRHLINPFKNPFKKI